MLPLIIITQNPAKEKYKLNEMTFPYIYSSIDEKITISNLLKILLSSIK